MLALQVSINGIVICTASVGAEGTTYFTLIERISDERSEVERERGERCVHLMLDGILREERAKHMEWLDRYLRMGEEISIKIVETDRVDRPANVSWSDPLDEEKQRREVYEQLKIEFEGQ